MSAKFEHDLVPQNIDPKNFILDTISLLKSLCENFTDHFTVEEKKSPDSVIWTLPDDTSFKPITSEKVNFPVCKAVFTRVPENMSHVYTELGQLNYNWRLQHCKLFEDIKSYIKSIKPDEKEIGIYNACIDVTNPLKNEHYSELQKLIISEKTRLTSCEGSGDGLCITFKIPQKHCSYSINTADVVKITKVEKQSEKEEEEEQEDEEDEEEEEEEEQ
jgi:hypothetical protein